jgi:serine/threonine-protein kinase
LTLGIPVAVKLIDPSIAQSEEALARFRREAQAAAELRSAHVVHIIDYGVDNGTPYIAMELLEGESLSSRLERVGRLTPADTVSILSQVTRALTRAHQQNIIHRDLKPENIFIIQEGDDEIVKVLDFGIAKKLGLGSTSSGVKTHTGAMLGTPYYMSPEQAKGHAGVDHRADIWSLGIIAYECVTGVRPFESQTLASLLLAICTERLPIPSQVAPVPQGFDAWFARVASRNLSERFQSASEAISQLRKICGVPTSAQSLEITASSAAMSENGVGPHALGQTGDPSAVTLVGAKGHRTRRIAVTTAAVLLLAAIGILAVRSYSRPSSLNANASASPSLSNSVIANASSQTAVIASADVIPSHSISAVPSLSAPAEFAKPDDAPSARAAKTHTLGQGQAAAPPGAKSADASKNKVGPPVTEASANAKNPAGKVLPQPARRDYDKSVGF